MARTIYKITILNWEKYNKNLKKGHKCVLISTRFFDDAKIQSLSLGGRVLYLSLLLRCGDVTSRLVEATHEDLLRSLGGSGFHVSRLLDQMQELQLLTYEKNTLSLNRREENRREEKRKELQGGQEAPRPNKQVSNNELNRKIWEAFRTAYAARYKVEPVRNASVNAKISQLGQRLGEEAVEVVKFFLTHNDGFYLKKVHDIGLCLKDAESLHTQWKRGRAITNKDIKNFESMDGFRQLAEDMKKGGF